MDPKISNSKKYVYSENESLLYDDHTSINLNDICIDIFNRFTMGASKDVIHDLLDKYINFSKRYGSYYFHKSLIDLFKFMFMIRDCRAEGRGLRDVFYDMFDYMYDKFPHIIYNLLNHIPIYGSWKDIFNLMSRYINKPNKRKLITVFIQIIEKQRNYDMSHDDMSLLIKYMPSEKSKHKKIAKILATHFYDKTETHMTKIWKKYRKDNSNLNKRLDTVEIKMCGDLYDKINYKKVPGKALKIYTNAFSNEILRKGKICCRYPDNDSRIEAAFNYKSFLSDKMISKKGSKLFPHEIIRPIIQSIQRRSVLPESQLELIQQQFDDWIEKMCDIMKDNESFLKMTLLCDVSGSMNGTPLEVSISLCYLFARAIAITEQGKYGKITWGNRIMIFSKKPFWHLIDTTKSLQENIISLCNVPWIGCNTDFLSVHENILEVAIENNIPDDRMPKIMLVTSDMQFDSASSLTGENGKDNYKYIVSALYDHDFLDHIPDYKPSYDEYYLQGSYKNSDRPDFNTHHEILCHVYKCYNYTFPLQIYWNLRGNTTGVMAKSDTPGTLILAGFNPSMMKSIFEGISLEHLQSTTPYDLFRTSIDSPRYKLIENTVNYSLKHCKFLCVLESFASVCQNKKTIPLDYECSSLELQQNWFDKPMIDDICNYFDNFAIDDDIHCKRKIDHDESKSKRRITSITDMFEKTHI